LQCLNHFFFAFSIVGSYLCSRETFRVTMLSDAIASSSEISVLETFLDFSKSMMYLISSQIYDPALSSVVHQNLLLFIVVTLCFPDLRKLNWLSTLIISRSLSILYFKQCSDLEHFAACSAHPSMHTRFRQSQQAKVFLSMMIRSEG
jgi:hypothetical protein